MFEFLIQSTTPLHLILFQLDLVLVAVTILALAITSLVKLHIGSFPVDLHILREVIIRPGPARISRTLAFFFPIIMGDRKWKWIITNISPSQGWKNMCFMLLKGRSKAT
jgi:hypothetical protein